MTSATIRNTGIGRPKKELNEKENPVAIRLSPKFLAALKEAALKKQKPWQTFVKETLANEIGYKSEAAYEQRRV